MRALQEIFSNTFVPSIPHNTGKESKIAHAGLSHQLRQIKLKSRVRGMN
jgi:hypothetical protein